MNTKVLLGASAGLMATAGLVLQFAPHEVLAQAGYPANGLAPVVAQLLGALYLGFALLNWMSKGVRMGGIYARPLAMGNLLHFFAIAGALLRHAAQTPTGAGAWAVAAAAYAMLAALFGTVLFISPRPEQG